MRDSTEPKYRKYVNLPENLVINMEKKIIDTATKAGIDAAKSTSKE